MIVEANCRCYDAKALMDDESWATFGDLQRCFSREGPLGQNKVLLGEDGSKRPDSPMSTRRSVVDSDHGAGKGVGTDGAAGGRL